MIYFCCKQEIVYFQYKIFNKEEKLKTHWKNQEETTYHIFDVGHKLHVISENIEIKFITTCLSREVYFSVPTALNNINFYNKTFSFGDNHEIAFRGF